MTALKIALRYLVAPKRHNVVNIIAFIAIAGIAVATTAMVVVLSVFNGFADIAAQHMTNYDPPLEVTRADGRAIANADSLAEALGRVPGVAHTAVTVSERGLAVTETAQCAVMFKGVPADYQLVTHVDSLVIAGTYSQATTEGVPAAQIAVGVANSLVLRPTTIGMLNVYVPRRVGRINPANPSAAFRGSAMAVSGVFQVSQPDMDADHVLLPLDVARDLMGYGPEGTAVELSVKPGADLRDVQSAVARAAGPDYRVLDRLQQRTEAFRMIAVEKWVTFMMLVFVLVIALFNILATLSLLIIEKRDNMRILRAMGATGGMVRRIFTIEAWLTTLAGGVIGTVVGVLLCLWQQYGQVIKLSGDASMLTVTAYPVRVSAVDLLAVLGAVALTGLISACAVRFMTRKL